MALGTNNYQSSNQGNNTSKIYEANYYSRLRIKNPAENLALTFTFWSGTLKVSITETGTAQEGRNNDLATIYFSPTKARIFAGCVQKIIDDPETFDIYGVDTGSGETRNFIAIGREMGKPFVFIAKVDKDGKYDSKYKFMFNVNYNYAVKVFDITTLKCQKEFDNTVELCQFRDILEDFARSSSGAYAYSVHDIGKYEAAKTSNLVRKLAEHAGVIDPSRYNNNGTRSNNSFFSGAGNDYENPSAQQTQKKKTSYQSIDDLDAELG